LPRWRTPSRLRHQPRPLFRALRRPRPLHSPSVSVPTDQWASVPTDNVTLVSHPKFSTCWGQTQVHFGAGSARHTGALVDPQRYGMRLALVTSRSNVRYGHADTIRQALGSRIVASVTNAEAHTLRESVEQALTVVSGTDGIIALGGGGAIGLGKAVAARHGLPLIVVPTTYSGSEMTPLYGVTVDGDKRVVRDPKAQPNLVIYDPDLALTLPAATARLSILNCLAHCFEASWLTDPSPLALAVSLSVCEMIGGYLLTSASEAPGRRESDLMVAGWLGGVALAAGGIGLHHAVCHVLGGITRASHAALHAIVLPRTLAVNESAAMTLVSPLARLLDRGLPGDGTRAPSAVITALCELWEIPSHLSQIWPGELYVDAVVESVEAGALERNPVPLSGEELRSIIEAIR
jgi:maleylacetate reductase